VTNEIEYDQEFQGKVNSVVDEAKLASEAHNENPSLEVEDVSPDDVASILYTSGTTGMFLKQTFNICL
jgi:long-subunit acyl-CoA synthetase (AMP-forming)